MTDDDNAATAAHEGIPMMMSDSITELAAALAKAQGAMENATKNAANPHYRSKYADLAEILNTVRPVLSAHGLSVSQWPGYADGMVTVETVLMHESGQYLKGTSSSPVGKPDAQGIGSATTYLRRYSLAAVCGLAQEDDDGQSATKPAAYISAKQAAELDALLTETGSDKARFLKHAKAESLEGIQACYFEDAKQAILKAAEARKAKAAERSRDPA